MAVNAGLGWKARMTHDVLQKLRLDLVPQPRRVQAADGMCWLCGPVVVSLPDDVGEEERFAAECLTTFLKRQGNVVGGDAPSVPSAPSVPISFSRDPKLPAQGYRIHIAPRAVTIDFHDPAGAYYAVQTLRQCLIHQPDGPAWPCLTIEDWPALRYRAAHYDSKHHQPTVAYVESLIEELAHYKVNVLVWEWEDKLNYRTHPEIGAPGAFTIEQMQAFTRHARRRHIQLVPLVQGLGHVSYILKHPRFRHLREIPASNWEFCPLKEGTYELLFDLWAEAMEATPGVEFLHIGGDETYELGEGEACGCKAQASRIGRDGLLQRFIHRCVEYIEKSGRRAVSWGGRWKAGCEHQPPRSMIFADSDSTEYLLAAKEVGYRGWVYAPNPGITPLFPPYFPTVVHSVWRDWAGREHSDFAQSSEAIGKAVRAGAVDGSVTTSWDDSGLHMQCWMPRLICGAEFSWNATERDIDQWAAGFFRNYFGPASSDIRELFLILQESAEFYDDTFERRVWHFGDIGKMHLPDFPRGDLEISDYWRRQYSRLLPMARRYCRMLGRAIRIIDGNLSRPVRHIYDLEVMRTCARLMRHNALLVLMLADLESELLAAHDQHYLDRAAALEHLRSAARLIEQHLCRRREVFTELVSTWERTRLPKGLSLPGKPFVYARDRARHFANRSPDMTYLILDEQKLDLESYARRLQGYIEEYERTNLP